MTNWDTPPDGLSPWNMSGFDKYEPFYPNDVLPPTVANTPHVATRLNDEQLIIATVLDQPHAWDAIRHLRPNDFDIKPLADTWRAISEAIRSRTPVTPQALNAIDASLAVSDLSRLAARSPRSIAACNAAAARLSGLKRARLARGVLRTTARDIEASIARPATFEARGWTSILPTAVAATNALASFQGTIDG